MESTEKRFLDKHSGHAVHTYLAVRDALPAHPSQALLAFQGLLWNLYHQWAQSVLYTTEKHREFPNLLREQLLQKNRMIRCS